MAARPKSLGILGENRVFPCVDWDRLGSRSALGARGVAPDPKGIQGRVAETSSLSLYPYRIAWAVMRRLGGAMKGPV